MGHVFCYQCIDKNGAENNENEQKQQHTFNQKCPLDICYANTLVIAPTTNLMISESEVICLYSFKAQHLKK